MGQGAIPSSIPGTDQRNILRGRSIDDTDSPYITGDENLLFVDTGDGAITANLATAQVAPRRFYRLIDIGGSLETNAVTLQTEGTESVDGADQSLTWGGPNYSFIDVWSDGTSWFTSLRQAATAVTTDDLDTKLLSGIRYVGDSAQQFQTVQAAHDDIPADTDAVIIVTPDYDESNESFPITITHDHNLYIDFCKNIIDVADAGEALHLNMGEITTPDQAYTIKRGIFKNPTVGVNIEQGKQTFFEDLHIDSPSSDGFRFSGTESLNTHTWHKVTVQDAGNHGITDQNGKVHAMSIFDCHISGCTRRGLDWSSSTTDVFRLFGGVIQGNQEESIALSNGTLALVKGTYTENNAQDGSTEQGIQVSGLTGAYIENVYVSENEANPARGINIAGDVTSGAVWGCWFSGVTDAVRNRGTNMALYTDTWALHSGVNNVLDEAGTHTRINGIVSDSYTGDGTATQTVELGFRPQYVVIEEASGDMEILRRGLSRAVLAGSSMPGSISLTDSGFSVGNGTGDQDPNTDTETYNFIAG